LTLRAEACSSTMAEGPAQSHRAVLAMDDMPAAAGCCTVAPVVPLDGLAGRPEDDWSRFLADLLPGIGACVAAAGTPAPLVLKALPMNHGLMLARLRTGEGRQDCIVEIGGNRQIERVEAVAAD